MNKTRNKIISIVCVALTALLLFTASSCFIAVNSRVRGNGTLRTERFFRSNFDSISIGGDLTVDIRQSETFSVTIDADENLFNYLYMGGWPESAHTVRRPSPAGLPYQDDLGEIVRRSLTATGAAALAPTSPGQGSPSGLPTHTTAV